MLEAIPTRHSASIQPWSKPRPGLAGSKARRGDYHQQPTEVLDKPDANGHLRHYGLDVVEKIRAAGFGVVTATDMSVGRPAHYQIHRGDIAFVCRK